jgi:excisionase family DNA binding protein
VSKESIRDIKTGSLRMKKIDTKRLEKTVDVAHLERMGTMLTAGNVARILNVHINTVRRWSNLGVLKVFRIGPRGDRRFRKEDVEKFLRE